MRSRIYHIPFNNVSVSAVQDLLAAYSGANMACEFVGLQLGQVTGTTVQNLRLRVRRLPATVTVGSGGSAPTPRPAMSGDVAATITARANDTVQATTNGTAVDLLSDVWNTINGYSIMIPSELRDTAKPGEALVVSLDQAPSGALTVSGTLTVGELF